MSSTRRFILINLVLFIVIAVAMTYYAYNNHIAVRGVLELSSTEDKIFYDKLRNIIDDIEKEAPLNSMITSFQDKLFNEGYYMAAYVNGAELLNNVEANDRSKELDRALLRANKLIIDGVIITRGIRVYTIIDFNDISLRYHIIDLNYTNYNDYYVAEYLVLLAFMSFTLAVIMFTAGIESKVSEKPLKQLSNLTNRLRRGNLDCEIKTKYTHSIGDLFNDFEALRKTLKESKQEREKMAKEREEYIAGITHDLKTPLTSLIGFSKGLLDGVAETKEKRDKYLRIIYDTSLHMNSLIEKLKEYSMLDSDKTDYKFDMVNMMAYIKEFVNKNAIAYLSHEVSITVRQGYPLTSQQSTSRDYYAMIDIEEFTRVLNNILSNTVKYKLKGICNVEIVISRGYGQIVITIKDDGPGVKEAELERIFDCFYRADSSRTRPTEGSGLGLYVVSKIVSAHNGTVKAVNDNGLKIIITLPEVNNEKKSINH